MIKQVKWGIIGCGNVTEKKSGPAFNQVEGSSLQAVMRRDLNLVQDYAERHHVPQWTNNADSLIHNDEVNAIYIATPPGLHAEYAIKAMKTGKPVYVEKPMAATYEQCEEMLRVSKETGMLIFVAYYRRSLPGFLKVKELIEDDIIGRVLYVNMRLTRPATKDEVSGNPWRLKKDLAGGGIFYDLASHQLDYLDFLFGPVVEANGIVSNRSGLYDVEDTISASLRYENGVIANGLWSFVTSIDAKEDVMEVIGSKGKIVFSAFAHTPIYLHINGEVIEFPYLNPDHIQYNLINQLVNTIMGKGTCISTGESAARTNKVMEQIVYKK
ncbi:Gfo/Idh/MocA family protein [Carboxylicivirga sp. N1Y90]|uniref:Gfo/Idh/MocA family protein n=1 Tax=Carboxylicivirga fragile TaxID=3417571 RepID=UPI003D354DF1|nr:Gfo/Idh/MocA family oxidoreductase [Marinilabiliaceae bacterium N1Y90]